MHSRYSQKDIGSDSSPTHIISRNSPGLGEENKIAILHDFHQALTSSVAQPSEGRTPFTLHSFSLWHLFKKGMIG